MVHLGDDHADGDDLARPEGNGPGGRGLALFYTRGQATDGPPTASRSTALKDKLGTRKVPTAELTLPTARAIPVSSA